MLPIPTNAVNGNIESLVIPACDPRTAPAAGRQKGCSRISPSLNAATI
jgi:hypothetical protein